MESLLRREGTSVPGRVAASASPQLRQVKIGDAYLTSTMGCVPGTCSPPNCARRW